MIRAGQRFIYYIKPKKILKKYLTTLSSSDMIFLWGETKEMMSAHDYYMKQKESRPKQVWKQATKTGKASRINASKNEIGAIPVRVKR